MFAIIRDKVSLIFGSQRWVDMLTRIWNWQNSNFCWKTIKFWKRIEMFYIWFHSPHWLLSNCAWTLQKFLFFNFFPCMEKFWLLAKWGDFNFVYRFEEASSRWFQKCVKCWVFLHFCNFITHQILQSHQQSLLASDALRWIILWKCTINPSFYIFSRSALRHLFKS